VGLGSERLESPVSFFSSSFFTPRLLKELNQISARFVLNYKRLRYRTEWVNMEDVEKTLRSIGCPPRSVLPVIIDPSSSSAVTPRVVMNTPTDSMAIVDYLEKTYPARPIFPDPSSRALQSLWVHWVTQSEGGFGRALVPLLVEGSLGRLGEGTKGWVGPDKGMDTETKKKAWKELKDQLDLIALFLDRNVDDTAGDGREVEGVLVQPPEISYADFALCSLFVWMERMGGREVWAEVRGWNGGRWAMLWEKCREYMDEF